jgi:hypothetical protein
MRAFLMNSCPNIEGQRDLAITSRTLGRPATSLKRTILGVEGVSKGGGEVIDICVEAIMFHCRVLSVMIQTEVLQHPLERFCHLWMQRTRLHVWVPLPA